MNVVQRFIALIHPQAPNTNIVDDEQRLSELAAQWRAAHAVGNQRSADWYAMQYQDIVRSLEASGWTEARVSVEAQLPAAVRAASRVIDRGEDELSYFAMHWRAARTRGDAEQADAFVAHYHTIVARMVAVGWTGRGLSPDAELPDYLMPSLFQDHSYPPNPIPPTDRIPSL